MDNIIKKNKSKVILFYSPQGGCGKTTLAVNTAIFSALFGNSTLLLDMAVYGCVNAILRISQKDSQGLSSILTLLDLNENKVNSIEFDEVLKSTVYSTDINNKLNVIIGDNPVKMDSIGENKTKTILSKLKTLNYDVIIIDTSSELCIRNLIMIEESDLIIIPVIQDISCGWKLVLL